MPRTDPVYFAEQVEEALKDTELYEHAPDIRDFLAYVASTESEFGTWKRQGEYAGKPGPARGMFQLEPKTAEDAYNYTGTVGFLKGLRRKLDDVSTGDVRKDLENNLTYQVLIGAVQLHRKARNENGGYDSVMSGTPSMHEMYLKAWKPGQPRRREAVEQRFSDYYVKPMNAFYKASAAIPSQPNSAPKEVISAQDPYEQIFEKEYK